MRRLTALVAVAALALAACGSGDGGSSSSADGKKYVAAIMRSYDDADADTKEMFTRAQARCMAEGVVDAVGADEMKKAGVTPSDLGRSDGPFDALGTDLTDQQADDLVAVITGGTCFDMTDLVVRQAKSGGGNPFGGLSEKKTRCLLDQLLDNAAFKDAMAESMLGKASSGDAFSNAFKKRSVVLKMLGNCDIRPSEVSG